jgi:hypothetical protein
LKIMAYTESCREGEYVHNTSLYNFPTGHMLMFFFNKTN